MSFSSVNSKNIDNVNSIDALDVGDLEVSNDLIVDGKVGIGTDNPLNILHVFDTDAGVTALIKIENTGANEDAALCFTNDEISIAIGIDGSDSNKFKISRSGNLGTVDQIVIDSGTNVGIGTANPSQKLDVVGDVLVQGGDLFLIDTNEKIASDGANMTFHVEGSEVVRFDLNGNVGIATTTVDNVFHVFDTDAGTAPLIKIENTGTDEDASLLFTNDGDSWTIGIDGSDSDKFKISDNTALGTNDRIVIGITGAVGIAITDPAEILHIDGRINLEQVSAPASTTDKLYNVAGNLTWNGVDISTVSEAGFTDFDQTGTNNIGLGVDALDSITTGNDNVAVGTEALTANTTGDFNVAIGVSALGTNIIGDNNVAVGYNALRVSTVDINTAIGSNALSLTTTGDSNVAVGANALKANITGFFNTAIGTNALLVSDASDNTAIGVNALSACTSGTRNVGVGVDALEVITDNGDCVAVGYNALLLNTGASNTAVGSQCLDSNTTGERHVAVGTHALGVATTADDCTAVGYFALQANTGSDNTAVGSEALDACTTGADNTAVGKGALSTLTGTSDSTAVGSGAMGSGTAGETTAVGSNALNVVTGSGNTAVGFNSGCILTSGDDNTAVGYRTLDACITGDDNTAMGLFSCVLVTGSANTAFGSRTLDSCTTGQSNTCIGNLAGTSIVSGNNNICIGANGGDLLSTNDSNNIMIGHRGVAGDDNDIRIGTATTHTRVSFLGNTATSEAMVHTGDAGKTVGGTTWNDLSDRRIKCDIADKNIDACLEKVNKLRLRSYRYQPWFECNNNCTTFNHLYTGWLTQELSEVYPTAVRAEQNVDMHYYDPDLGVTHTIENIQSITDQDAIWNDGIGAIQSLSKRQERIIRRLEELENK